jgi:acetyltransferase-like isoleucine patch superfamily enzyme
VGSQVWIASDVFIAPGIHIGDAAVVGSRSSVFNDLPAAMLCYGNPATPIRPRFRNPQKFKRAGIMECVSPSGIDTHLKLWYQ